MPQRKPDRARRALAYMRRAVKFKKRKGMLIKRKNLPKDIGWRVNRILGCRFIRSISTSAIGGSAAALPVAGWMFMRSETMGLKVVPAVVGLGFAGMLVTVPKAALQDHRAVMRETEALGYLLKNSKNPKIVELRQKFKYAIVDIRGNIRGTNKKPKIWGSTLGRKRMELK